MLPLTDPLYTPPGACVLPKEYYEMYELHGQMHNAAREIHLKLLEMKKQAQKQAVERSERIENDAI
jgi:hypothetical protein